ncbi:MAG: hypothetical protein ABSE90_01260 [Verrucomicrobiota bacterium]
MKTTSKLLITGLTLLMLATLNLQLSAAPVGTAFTYQGRLIDGGAPATGNYDFWFKLYNDPASGTQQGVTVTPAAVPVSNGLFTVVLDFGPGVFTGDARWLDIWVHNSTNDPGVGWIWLSPRQPLTPAPHAIFATTASNVSGTVSAAQLLGALPGASLSGTYGGAVTLNNAGNSFTGNGGGLTGLNASQLASGTMADTRLSANVALLNANQTFTGADNFSGNISLLDPTKSITFAATGGANSPMINMFASGTMNADRMVIAHSPSFPDWGLQYQDTWDRFNFISWGIPVLTIDLDYQNVSVSSELGIGTTSPYFPLDVLKSQAVGRFTSTNSQYGSVLELDNNSPAIDYYGAINFQGGPGQIGYHTNNIMTFRTAGTERMRIDGNGNIGIGTSTPAYPLDIAGRMRLRDGGGAAGLWLNTYFAPYADNENIAFIGVLDDTRIGFYGNDPRGGSGWGLTFDTINGNVGIGTGISYPTHSLEVNGTMMVNDNAQFMNYVYFYGYVYASSLEASGTVMATNLQANGTMSAISLRAPGAGVGTDTFAFIHKATSGSIAGHVTTITNPQTDGQPGALLYVTHNWSQDYMSDSHPVGVYYDSGHWKIYHEDGAAMQVGQAYNVMVIKP